MVDLEVSFTSVAFPTCFEGELSVSIAILSNVSKITKEIVNSSRQ